MNSKNLGLKSRNIYLYGGGQLSDCSSTTYKEQNEPIRLALKTLKIFTGVNQNRFDLALYETVKNEKNQIEKRGVKGGYRKYLTEEQVREILPQMMERSINEKLHFVITPNAVEKNGIRVLQLDDVKKEVLEIFKPYIFLAIETSPENYHAWFAFENISDWQLEQVRKKLIEALKSDQSSQGVNSRLPGSRNYKHSNPPLVLIAYENAGRLVTVDELVFDGLISSLPDKPKDNPSPFCVPSSRNASFSSTNKQFPDWYRCLNHPKVAGDYSKADWQFCLISFDRDFSSSEIAQELSFICNSVDRPHKKGKKYIVHTVNKAYREWRKHNGNP